MTGVGGGPIVLKRPPQELIGNESTASFDQLQKWMATETSNKPRIIATADVLASFNKGLMDEVNGRLQDLTQLATQRWTGRLAMDYPPVFKNDFAPLVAASATITDAEKALRELPGAIDVANGHLQDIADAREPSLASVPNPYSDSVTLTAGIADQEARDQAWGFLHPLMDQINLATQKVQAVGQTPWTGPQAVDQNAPAGRPGATPPGVNPAGPKPADPGSSPKPVNPAGPKPADPGAGTGTGAGAGAGAGAGQSAGAGSGAGSPTGGGVAPIDPGSVQPVGQQPGDQLGLAGSPTPTAPFTPPPATHLPQVKSPQQIDPVSFSNPIAPQPPLAKLPTVRSPADPLFTDSNPTTATFLPSTGSGTPISGTGSVTGSGTARPGGSPSSSAIPETAGDPAAARGGMPYMPPMGGMGGGMGGKNGEGEVKPGVAESPGGPALGQRGKPSQYAGVPDELRGRSADKPSGPKPGSPRRRGKKTALPKPEVTGEVLDEHLWRVKPPTASGS